MRTINRISAHSPRSFLSITFGIRFFIATPQNEKRRHSWKNARMPPICSFDSHSTTEGKKIVRKKWERFPKQELDDSILQSAPPKARGRQKPARFSAD
jgi:hypothetical protein